MGVLHTWRQAATAAAAAGASLALTTAIAFAVGAATPGDAFSVLELDPEISRSAIAALRRRYLPSEPLGERIVSWLRALAHGDLGFSLAYHRPILELLRERLPATIEVVALATLLAWVIALALALAVPLLGDGGAAKWVRGTLAFFLSAWASLPVATVALAAVMLLPSQWAAASPPDLPWVPAAVLALGLIPALYFQAMDALAALLPQPFIAAARARGNGRWRVLWRHALPNASDTLVPLVSISITQIAVETVIVETLLNWPGIGQLSMQAVAQRDLPLLSALVLLTGVLVVTTNIISDLVRFRMNPRLASS
jgi:ABC-type dipeptide/oligopeptide/nickel transport system permease component